jgi:hypothetical protein
MSKLYIAGDSFATLSKTQPLGVSWSELLAKELNLELVNVSRVGASNESICIQLDYITERVLKDDLVVCLLTDSFRKTLPSSYKDLTKNHLLQYHSLHEDQNYIGDIVFQDEIYIEPYTHLNCTKSKDAEFYFKTFYNHTYQKWLEVNLITGMLAKLKSATDSFILCSGGFDDKIYSDNIYPVTNTTFLIEEKNFLHLSSSKILKLHSDAESCNHMSVLGHQTVFRLILKNLLDKR